MRIDLYKEPIHLDEPSDDPPLFGMHRLVVLVDEKPVLSFEEARIAVQPPPSRNVTGGDNPQLIVTSWSGGAHCCFLMQILDLGDEPQLTEVPLGEHLTPKLIPDASGGWVAVGVDNSFAYWHASFAESPAPRVELRYRGGKWRLADDQMRRPPPSDGALADMVARISAFPWGEVLIYDNPLAIPPTLWGGALDLAYSGNLDAAERFFELAWKPGFDGKEDFRHEFFDCKLRESPFWPDVAVMNGRPALPPDCP